MIASTPKSTVPVLSARGIVKDFPGVRALNQVDFELMPGEIHALIGENGAGKSTLIKIFSGAVQPDEGSISILGRQTILPSPPEANKQGIVTIYQEGSLAPNLTVSENLFLGREINLPPFPGVIDKKIMKKKAAEVLAQLGTQIDPLARVDSLSMAERQLVEIARALLVPLRVLILDEPTSSLTDREITHLFQVIKRLTAEGVGVIYISHKLEEVKELAHRATVLRDGCLVRTVFVDQTQISDLISMMIGRGLSEELPTFNTEFGRELLRVQNLTKWGTFANVNLSIRSGEIVGLAGLVGAGQSEVLRAIFGATPTDYGSIFVDGKAQNINSPADAISVGIGYIPADRKGEGIIAPLTVLDNISLMAFNSLAPRGIVRRSAQLGLYQQLQSRLKIRATHPYVPISTLSGGNQQKVILGRMMATKARVLLFDEPTRGVDVGAKFQIYQFIRQMVDQGGGALVWSPEMKELLTICDTIVVMREGSIAGILPRHQATEERIMNLIFDEKAN